MVKTDDVMMFYRVTTNTELANIEPFALAEKHRVRLPEPL